MLMACRKASILLSGFIVTSAVLAATGRHPTGYWVLESTDRDMPFGGLKLNKPDHFELLIYDNDCKRYTVKGSIKQKKAQSWELKNAVDYSNIFMMTREGSKLKLIDTEDQKMFFSETTSGKLEKKIKQHCTPSPDKKVNK